MNKVDEIRDRILSRFPVSYDTSEGTVLWDMAQAYALEEASRYEQVEQQRIGYFLKNITDPEILDLKLADYGKKRKEAIKSEGIITIKGVPDTFVEKGTKVASELTEYETLNSMFIGADGTVDIPIVCCTAGKIGNATVGVINSFPLTLPGCYECYNKNNLTNGVDLESVEEAKRRVEKELSEPTTSGNTFHYKLWAKQVPGVGNARTIPKWNGKNTVKVLIVDRSNNIASSDLIKQTFDYIETVRPVGPTITVESAVVKNIDVSLERLRIDTNANQTYDQVVVNLKTALTNFINSISLDDNVVSYAITNNTVINVDGVSDFLNLKLNNVIGSAELGINEIAKFRNLYIDGVLK